MTRKLILKAMRVALIVGTVLLLINQFDAVFGEQEVRWLPALLTYCVPFAVFILGQKSKTQDT